MIGIYVRVSTEEQAKNGYSIQDQIRQCRKKAKGNEVIEYIDDGHSGEYLERPALKKLRKDVRDGVVDTVIVYDPDRWSRNLMNQLIVTEEIEKRAKLVFVNSEYDKTPEGRMFYQIRGSVSEFEKAKINERMSRGRKEKAEQGKVVKNSKMYGYAYNKETSLYEIHESEAKIVKLIFDLYTMPDTPLKGVNGIAMYLSDQGIPTKRGAKVWHRQVVRQILLNRAYIGDYIQNRWNTEGMLGNKYKDDGDKIQMRERPQEEWIHVEIPQIIDKAQFERAQNLLGVSKRRHTKDSQHQYLLSGLLKCGECENTMTGRRAKNWGTYGFEYTDVKNYSGAKFKGCGMRVACEKLDKFVWDAIVQRMERVMNGGGVDEEEEERESLEQIEYNRISQELEKTAQRRRNLIKLFADFGDDEAQQEYIREEMRELSDREKVMKVTLEQLSTAMSTQNTNENSKQTEEEIIRQFADADFEGLAVEDKRAIIRSLVREVRVYKDKIDIYGF